MYSFSIVNAKGKILRFCGLENFQILFKNPTFTIALRNTLYLTAMFVPLNLACSLGLALLAAQKRRLSPVYETMFTMPMAVSMPSATLIFRLLLHPTIGIVNYRLGLRFGWFLDASTAMYGILLICLFMGIPFDFLLFLSALRNTPRQLIEAAKLDGAGYLTRLLRVQIPLITPTILYVVSTNMVLAMMTSGPVLIATHGGPGRSTTTLIYMMYASGYQSSNYSAAACLSIVTFVLTFGMVLAAVLFERGGVHYE
ncbi:MAG: sugar ABC transporter permease [Treponema sp.]|jgi:sn-glycerol 3-phosphate transport system permease protein|nr:sugar ABC transporter permease [Treponema sp.]